MPTLGDIRFPDAEYEKPFRVYSNYLVELASVIGGRYGLDSMLADGIQEAMRRHPPLRRIEKRGHGSAVDHEIERCLNKAWGIAYSLERNIEGEFIEEANTWMPGQAYYAVHHAIRAVLFAAGARAPADHRKVLNAISREVVDGRFIFPWSAACEGCPSLQSERFLGVVPLAEEFSVLSSPDPESAETRIAILLKTTRQKELERRFSDERNKGAEPGRSRRNLSRARKQKMADNLQATTLFDFFFRLRKKVHYGDPDVFVLGAAGGQDARQLAEALTIVTDATVSALECLVAAYRGRSMVARTAIKYADRLSAEPDTLVGRRSQVWGGMSLSASDSG